MPAQISGLPDQLPEKPTGWTKHMVAHFNFGGAGGAAAYEIKDEKGQALPIGYHYDTRKGQKAANGFSLPDVEKLMTWPELRDAWPKWIEEQRRKEIQEELSK